MKIYVANEITYAKLYLIDLNMRYISIVNYKFNQVNCLINIVLLYYFLLNSI